MLGSAMLLLPIAHAFDSPESYLDAMDRNGDGRIDLAEFQAWMMRGFDRMDVNRNGVLDLDEQPAGRNRRPVSRSEQLRVFEAAFHRQDLNGDGYLDARELSAPPR
jgi:hypothetical protein